MGVRLDTAMYVFKAFAVFFWVGLSTSSIPAANKTQSLTLTQNITVTNAQYVNVAISLVSVIGNFIHPFHPLIQL